jgi:hypothetical protein
MAEQQPNLNPYSSPMETPSGPLGVSDFDQHVARPIGIGYFVILVVNCIGLILSLPLFGAIGDSYAPFVAVLFGGPLLAGQALFGLLPASIYYTRNLGLVAKRPLVVLLVISIVAISVTATGTILDVVMPRTHGCGC